MCLVWTTWDLVRGSSQAGPYTMEQRSLGIFEREIRQVSDRGEELMAQCLMKKGEGLLVLARV